MNPTDTTWVLVSTALVMLMTPSLGLFYGGLVRSKNVLTTIMQSFFMLQLIGVQWVLYGYSLAFGPDSGGIIGSLAWLGLKDVGLEPSHTYAKTIPHQAFMVFQMAFAAITPALISGAFAERQRFQSFAIFSLLWATLVYDPVAHWVWADGGWLAKLGALDFAGGTVVHITSGVSALVCALVIGRRISSEQDPILPHNATMTMLGTGLLWFGWFGFNAGSALGANSLAVVAFVTTNTAAAMGGLTWLTASWLVHRRPSVLGASAGTIAGLVAITPAAGYVTPVSAILIGFIAGLVCFIVVDFQARGRVDDALDVFGIHGVGGMIGAFATGVFATTSVNPSGANGLLAGNSMLLAVQILAILAVSAYSAIMTFVLLKFVDLVIGLRVSAEEEEIGLDVSQHRESGYQNLQHLAAAYQATVIRAPSFVTAPQKLPPATRPSPPPEEAVGTESSQAGD